MTAPGPLEVEARHPDASGKWSTEPLGQVDAAQLVGDESPLKLDRPWLADLDPKARWIANQPFWLGRRNGPT